MLFYREPFASVLQMKLGLWVAMLERLPELRRRQKVRQMEVALLVGQRGYADDDFEAYIQNIYAPIEEPVAPVDPEKKKQLQELMDKFNSLYG